MAKQSHFRVIPRRLLKRLSGLTFGSSEPPSYEESCLNLERADPCLRAAWKNYMHSKLIRLPDAVLVAIMEKLDIGDIIRLRWTCRTFLRLFSHSMEFQHLHLTRHDDEDQMRHVAGVWAVPRELIHTEAQPKFDWLPFCDSCKTKRRDEINRTGVHVTKSVPFIYCSGCRLEHRATFFSPRQRHKSSNDKRICLGHEHSLVLCDHKSVTWESANRLADRPPGKNVIRCSHRQHTNASGCSHIRAQAKESTCHHDDRPQLKIWRDHSGDLCLEMSATVHVPFQPASSRNGQVSSLAFGSTTKRVLNKYVGRCQRNWFLRRFRKDFMRPFDPNLCSCLDWGADERLHHTSSPFTAGFAWELCADPAKEWRERPARNLDFYTGADESQKKPGDRCAGFRHGFRSVSLDGKKISCMDFLKCRADHDYGVLRGTYKERVHSAYDPRWLLSLDHLVSIWGMDREMHGISWCPDSLCCLRQRFEAWKGNGPDIHRKATGVD